MSQNLPFDVDDDEAAMRYVNYAVRQPQEANWKALIADGRVAQTYRVLRRLESQTELGHLRRHEQIRQAELDRDAGLIGGEDFVEQYRGYVDWRSRAASFDGALRRHLDMVRDRVRVACRDSVIERLRASVLTLALAIDDHRTAHAGEESLADTALWARLRTLSWPMDAGVDVRTLLEVVQAERVRRGPARVNSEGFIDFEGRRTQGTTVDVADLILEVTDHLIPAISRTTLTELWRQRASDLLASEAAKVNAKRQVGNYASQRLRKALLYLEHLGMIARITDESGPQITVTDRAKLGALRRRWDEKYFTMYELEH